MKTVLLVVAGLGLVAAAGYLVLRAKREQVARRRRRDRRNAQALRNLDVRR